MDGDFVERKEFKALLMALAKYFELYEMFEVIDTGADRRCDLQVWCSLQLIQVIMSTT